jgi:hypothetical protein
MDLTSAVRCAAPQRSNYGYDIPDVIRVIPFILIYNGQPQKGCALVQ